MNKTLQRQLRKYCHKVNKLLPDRTAAKRVFIRSLRMNIEDYIMENDVTDFSQIESQFGTAEEIAEAYLAELSGLDFSRWLRRLKIFRMIAVLIVCGMVIFFIVFVHGAQKSSARTIAVTISDRQLTSLSAW